MIKLLRYEIKKMLPAYIFITAVLIIISYLSNMNATYISDNNFNAINSPLSSYAFFGGILTLIAPIVYMFKMKKINVDHYYQLPLKREKIYIIHYIVGLLMIMIPLAISFLVTMAQVCSKEHIFDLKYAYLYFLVLMISLTVMFTIFSFAFSRCNTYVDGILNVFSFSYVPFIIILAFLNITTLIDDYNSVWYSFNGIIFTPLGILTNKFNSLFCNKTATFVASDFIIFGCWAFAAIIFGILSVILIKYDKAENSMQKSDSWFGYKIILPIITICILSLGVFDESYVFILLGTSITMYGLYALAERNIKIGKKNLIVLGICIAVGVLLSIITGLY